MIEFFRNSFKVLFSFCMILGIVGVFIGGIGAFSLHPVEIIPQAW